MGMDRLRLELELEKNKKLSKNDISILIKKLKSLKKYGIKIKPDSHPIGNEGNETSTSFYDLQVNPDAFPNIWKIFETHPSMAVRYGMGFSLGVNDTNRNNIITLSLKDTRGYASELLFKNQKVEINAFKELINFYEQILNQFIKEESYKVKNAILSMYSEHSGIHIWHYCKVYLLAGESIKSLISHIMGHTGQEKLNQNKIDSLKEKFAKKVSEDELIRLLEKEGFKLKVNKKDFKLLEISNLSASNITTQKLGYATCYENFLIKVIGKYLPSQIPLFSIKQKQTLKDFLAYTIIIIIFIILFPFILIIDFFKSIWNKLRKDIKS